MYNLKALKISIATEYGDDGEPLGFYEKDVNAIVTEGDPYELQHLRRWIELHLFRRIGWTGDLDRLDLDVIDRALSVFETLGIKPTDCIYEPETTNEADE